MNTTLEVNPPSDDVKQIQAISCDWADRIGATAGSPGQCLALYMKTRNFHWRVRGQPFAR